ncbi:diacylglycerol-acyltransferase [Coniophora puteana RWD-64-598 SS2]|uniref:Diacylglycerol O-acyltransferase n=1 Tax=Coniophora puteana (strain RWD-64-598) TaxID=741705 RepID=A0A5M3M7I4_CONPW|nr:diacylglycerol-acyltransferase [Coniophora puteana RWD-64-598 SS2]EIW75198.1 diacylglycerol-acyltransferase [Coniophora puteana RWD-64-598 SS2]
MLVVAAWSCMIPIMFGLFLYLCSVPALWPFIATYWIWVHYIDTSPAYGTRLSPWFRSLKIWQYFADYYPASYVPSDLYECDLPADRPYVFGYHPHGEGAMATFATEGTGFSRAFPGIRPHVLTLTSNFKIPLYREIIMALGVSSVSKRSCSNILSGKGWRGAPKFGPDGDRLPASAGEAITIVVGGAAESLSARPGTADLTLRKRLGFIKIAIQHGADLVPVFSFGENDIYQQMPNERGTTVYTVQKKFQSVFGFTFPLFHGRGLLNYNLGLLPYRRRIVSVIGRPIHVERTEKPTTEEVMRIQSLYIEELMRIWNTYKDEFAKTRTRELSIID